MPTAAHINRIGTAVPENEVHALFVGWARARLEGTREAALFDRMADRSGIKRRWSVLPSLAGSTALDAGGFFHDESPRTGARMAIYAEEAPRLALKAIGALGELGPITHLVVASCTGFIAPGIDQIIVAALGLGAHVERSLVGFMGCYAAIVALRQAHHIVRSEPQARVLVVTVELCTLHLQQTLAVDELLAMLQFGDGAAAAIVSAEETGLAITRVFAAALPDSAEMIRWRIGDNGFVMNLSGAVPNRIAAALRDPEIGATVTGGAPAETIDHWAVHAGGRSVLDAVERALDLPGDALRHSRDVLADNGNISSSTLMFVLARLLAERATGSGVAVAFGPGLTAEGLGFEAAA
ncbi:type III polyketide synthase [Sphingomonas bacterium]|uniref:type III polyketide synthase n=1 Tax=Sphingomonas bacterium TaxID=1895847 RepID=UPI0015762E36|nr:type III polyketide synthase [Sphingomonas bacterium]